MYKPIACGRIRPVEVNWLVVEGTVMILGARGAVVQSGVRLNLDERDGLLGYRGRGWQ